MQTETSNTTKQPNAKPNNGRKKWLIGGAIILLAGILIAVNFTTVKLYCAYVFKCPHFSKGDRIYLKKTKLPDGDYFRGLILFRMIKPLNEREIDTLEITDRQKAVLKAKIDPSAQPYLFETGQGVNIRDKSGFLGIYEGQRMCTARFGDKSFRYMFYKIDNFTPELAGRELPEGYTYADNIYYVEPFYLSAEVQDIPKQK
jgi:hypothetical protein